MPIMVPRKAMRTEMFISDRWVDISAEVREDNGLNITYGSGSQDRSVPPATFKAKLNNPGDKYSRRNPLGANYKKITTNTPVRVTLGLTADSFDRLVSNAWGTSTYSDVWATYTATGTASDFNVTAAGGTHLVSTAAQSRLSYLPFQQHRDVDVAATFTLGLSNVTGGDIEPGNLVVRGMSTTDYLMARAVIKADETVTLKIMHASGTIYGVGEVTVPGLTFSGQALRVRAQVEGGNMRAKVWAVNTSVADSDGEPNTWHVEAEVPLSVAGFVGVRSGVGGGNTNVPVTFTYRNFEVRSARFIGEAATMAPNWNLAETDRTVNLDAAGLLQRLQKGSSPLKSTLRRSIPGLPDLVQYWPMEDGSESQVLASALTNAPPMIIDPAGDQTLSTYDGFASSEPIPTLGKTIWRGVVPTYASTGEVQSRWIMHMSKDGVADNNLIHRTWTGGTVAFWDVSGGATPGQLRLTANTGSTEILNISIGFDLRDQNGRVSLELKQNGANIDWGLWFLEVDAGAAGGLTGTVNNQTLGAAQRVDFSLNGDLKGSAIGHVTVEKKVTSVFNLNAQLNAYNGEAAATRMGRLCFEEGIPISISGAYDADARMGPQRPATVVDLLKDCAKLDMGILGESRGRLGLKYRTRLGMINQAPVVVLDRAAGQLSAPFLPVDDPRLTLNDITAERTNGSSYRVEQLTGPLSVSEPPAGAGRIDTKETFNAYRDQQLPDLAGLMLSLGTVDDYRFPSITGDLAVSDVAKVPAVVAGLLSLDIGDRLQVIGTAPLGIYDTVDQMAYGYVEAIYPHTHTIQANSFPALPYVALRLDDTNLGRADSGSSTTNAGFSATATSFTVATTDVLDLWTTTPGEFPLDVMIAGERIRLSAISGATSPQTFTVATGGRAINGVAKAHLSGESVNVATPVRLA